MTAYLFAEPTVRPLTASGDIMPGAYLQFYQSGTTTPTDVYSDAGLTTPLENPVEADSDGRFPPIYVDPAVLLRVQLYDADDVLVYDVDPYLPVRDFAPGTVLMFYGTEEALEAAYPPALWQQLNGENGAPDIRDRFPIGVSASLSPGDTGGGSGTVNTSTAGAHDHNGSVSAESLTEAQMPAHHHSLLGSTGSGVAKQLAGGSSAGISGHRDGGAYTYHEQSATTVDLVDDTGDGDPHAHDISEDGDHIHTVDITPPYCALFFIMRRSS